MSDERNLDGRNRYEVYTQNCRQKSKASDILLLVALIGVLVYCLVIGLLL